MAQKDRRLILSARFRALLSSNNVYFQPPASLKMQYPCIVYNLANANDVHADDKIYRRLYRYTVTYITKDPDDPKRDEIDDLRYCSFDRFFTSDNLNHFVYTIYN